MALQLSTPSPAEAKVDQKEVDRLMAQNEDFADIWADMILEGRESCRLTKSQLVGHIQSVVADYDISSRT